MNSYQEMVEPTESSETTETTETKISFHTLSDKWTLWAHLPHDTDWSINSYKNIYSFNHVENAIALCETIPEIMIKNCMLFLMRGSIKPTWEDSQNKSGGSFSFKILNKNVFDIWKQLLYSLVGNTISNDSEYLKYINGITISPKKNFCIIKIWMTNCKYQNPDKININIIKGLGIQGCLFRKHIP